MKASVTSKIITNPDQVDVQSFDLENQEHRIGAIQSIIDNFSHQFERLAKNSFHSLLRQTVDFKMNQQETLRVKDYILQIKQPSVYREFLVSPHDLHGTIAIDGELLFHMVDLFFGGSGKKSNHQSDFSDTEIRLVERFFNTLLQQFSSSWHNITDWDSKLLDKNTLNLFHPNQSNQLYQVCRFNITIGSLVSGWLDISLPFLGLDFLRDNNVQSNTLETAPELQAKIEQKIYDAPIRLITVLAEKSLSLGQIMNLSPGDVIPVELPEQVIVKAGDTPLFKARVAEKNSSLVLEIKEIITST